MLLPPRTANMGLQIPGSLTMDGLHHVLQTALGWTDSHLHRFSHGRTELRDGLAAGQAFGRKGAEVLYEYDFGDSWEVQLVLEEIPGLAERAGPACFLSRRRHQPGRWMGHVEGRWTIVAEYPAMRTCSRPSPTPNIRITTTLSSGQVATTTPSVSTDEAINRALTALRRLR